MYSKRFLSFSVKKITPVKMTSRILKLKKSKPQEQGRTPVKLSKYDKKLEKELKISVK